MLFIFVEGNVRDEAQLRFERQASDAQHVIEMRIKSYADVIQGLRALFHTSDGLSRPQFHSYVSGLDLQRNYPGFQSLNYAEYVPAEGKTAFESKVRQDSSLDARGYPDFAIKPAGNRLEYFVLTYLEPTKNNRANFGLDISVRPEAAIALAAGRDTGNLITSGRLIRIDGPNKHIGLAMRLPLYRNGMPLATVAQRRAAYIGSVGAGFHVQDLMRGVLDESTLAHMRFKLYDTGPTDTAHAPSPSDNEHLLFDSNELLRTTPSVFDSKNPNAFFMTKLPMRVGGRIWEIQFSSKNEAIINQFDVFFPWLTLVTGLLMSVLLFFVLYSVTSSRSRALAMAKDITKDLRESEMRLTEAQQMAHLGNWSLNPLTGIMDWSAETFRIFGLDPSAVQPDFEKFLRGIHEDDRASLQEALQKTYRSAQEFMTEHRISHSDGTTRWVQTICRPAQHPREALLQGTLMDITERKQATLRAEIEHKVTQLVASSADADEVMPKIIEALCNGFGWACGIFRVPDDKKKLHWTASWSTDSVTFAAFLSFQRTLEVSLGPNSANGIWNTSESLVIRDFGTEPETIIPGAAQSGLRSAVAFPILSSERIFGVIECFSLDVPQPDETLPQMLKSISTQIGQYLQRKATEKTLQYLATHDPLTDLPNRSMFNQVLRHALSRSARYNNGLALLFIDIDRFKNVNDTLGHSAGDRMLQECANRFTECLRDSDIIARLGGDEFVVIIENFSAPRDIIAVAEKILVSVAKPFFIDTNEFLVNASIGISTFPDDGTDIEILLKNADTAMYRAKQQGNRYQFYSVEMNKHSFERFAMESSLRGAIERKEFLLHYQPKVDLRTGRITGVEALIRWRHPDWGLVSPGQFIPLAEESGLIVEIGKWVLKTACAQNRRWQEQGFPLMRVAVNLSARQFMHEHLLRDITETVSETGLTPDCLEIEITESMGMQNAEQAIMLLWKLKNMGIHLSIDDFGTGYSSLAYLKRLPVDCVKIDRSFIKDIPREVDDMAITTGIISLAHSLRLKVVAEGVETIEQYEFLRKNGCDEIQGYFFSKPLPVEEITALLEYDYHKFLVTVVESRTQT